MSGPRPDITVELLNERGSEYLPGYLGIEIVELAPHTLRCRMAIKKLHIAPNNFLHAASVVALADTACGYATIAHLPEGAESFTTIELKSNFLGTARDGGSVACVATAQHLGRNT
ncbi:MAG: PaaI family thioesterase, partial [Candidatus Competibacteraceae bacterium]